MTFVKWDTVSKFMDKLPETSREEFKVFILEGCVVAKTSLQSTLDMADALDRVMASAVFLRRASWWQNSDIALDVQQTTEDLLFCGWFLFLDKTDETLHLFKDSQALCSLGVYILATKRCH